MQRACSYVKRWTWLLILCPLLAGGTTFALALTTPPVYEATANLVFGLANPTNPGSVSPEVAAQLGSTYAIMLESPQVLQTAAAQLGLQETPEQLASQVHATYQSGSNIITLTADAASDTMAIRLADTVVNVFRQVVQQVSPFGKNLIPWDSAHMNPVKQKGITFSTVGIAIPLGLLVALSFVALLYYLDDTIFTPEEGTTVANLSVLSAPLPQAKQSNQGNPASQREADDTAALLLEAVRVAVSWPATIFCAWATARERDPQRVMDLAQAAARSGLRVLVINTDSRYQWLQEMYGLSEARGLGSALLANHTLESYIVPLPMPGIAAVPSGPCLTKENDVLLSPQRLAPLIAPLRQHADLVLITGAPILASPTAALTQVADGVVLMATMQHTQRRHIREALTTLHYAHARILGIAFGSAHKQSKFVKKQTVQLPPVQEANKTVRVIEMQESN